MSDKPGFGQVAIVTGAAAGIGRAIALRLAGEGMAVVVADVDERRGPAVVREIEAGQGTASFLRVDVTAEQDIQAMVSQAVERYGAVDVLVNNAGGAPSPNYPDAALAHWSRTLDLNLRGVMMAIQACLPVMHKQGGGAIVNIASIAGLIYRPYDAPEYAAGKAGVIHLTAALGSLQPRYGVRVNCICPGWVETEAVKESLRHMSQEEREQSEFPPPKRLIQPEEIAELVMMFVRDASLVGRVLIWPDGETWRLMPVERLG
jgi:NAD(P)-dependent dehydrogenase (short-subunit alcohol dehydrogenase family)